MIGGRSGYAVALVLILLLPGIGHAAGGSTVTDITGIEYTPTFNESTDTLTVVIQNPTEYEHRFSFSVQVDFQYSFLRSEMISSGNRMELQYDLSEGIDLTRDVHTVKLYIGDSTVEYNFTRDIDPASTDRYATPQITDVRLVNTTHNGQRRTKMVLSGYNPTGRGWIFYVAAHTLESTGNYAGFYFPPNGYGNATIVLEESAGEYVAGEVRLFEKNFTSREYAFDQIEVYGRSGENATVVEEEYKIVSPPSADDPYTYQNNSAYRKKIGSPQTIWESPVFWVLGVAVVAVVSRFLKRR